MAIANAAVTVGTTPTRIAAPRIRRLSLVVQNGDAAAIFVGDSAVAASGAKTGISVAAGATQPFEQMPGEVFAISAAGTSANAVRVIESF